MTTRITFLRLAIGGALLSALLTTLIINTTPAQATPAARSTYAHTAAARAVSTRATPDQATPERATRDQATPARVAAAAAVATLPIPSPASKLPKLKGPLTRGQIAAAAALTQLGVSFSWGGGSAKGPTLGIGRGATTRGFDCSGLTLYAWSRAGIRLSHHTAAQFRQGRRIPLGARRTGDLLFFGGNPGAPTHVALFLTGTLMIHAPKTGDVVRRANFNTPYFRTTYRGTVRPG
ncbi:NlpC/P60 family protein [Nonomuraea fuscirosea]|uniref:C40 family peptidase n=1 Tax=Nonomuraea fuscirosea TaxID=1291556 RepID=UPI0034268824